MPNGSFFEVEPGIGQLGHLFTNSLIFLSLIV
jgi:hypothetical protein